MPYQKSIKIVTRVIIIFITLFLVFCIKPDEDSPIFIPLPPLKTIADTIPPVIQLTEGAVELNLGEIFKDPGCRVIDNPGLKDITERLIKTVKDSKNTIKDSNTFYLQEGEYTIYYNATDSSDNIAEEKTRKVIVNPVIEESNSIISDIKTDTLLINQPLVDLEVLELDNFDSAIIEKIEIEGDKVDFSKPGEYKIKYTVSDKEGNITKGYRTVIIKVKKNAPKAEAGPDMTVGINESINLHGKGNDTDGSIVKYEWKFGNSAWIATSTGDTTITAPSAAQEYVCSLRVTDNDGLTGVDRIVIKTVSTGKDKKNAPRAVAGPDKAVGINEPVNLTGTGIHTDGSIVKYEWKFGNSAWVETSTGDTTITAPSTAQTYVCSLRVTNDNGLTGTDDVIITVSSSAPTAKTGPDTTVGINDSINLHGKGFDTDGSIVKYEWKFGSSDWVETSTGDTTIITSSTAQTYVCSLRVTDDDGLTGTDGIIITVSPTVKDIDGNVYHTVKIGNQIWTVENLRTTKYNDGTDIINIIRDREWAARSAGTSAYCYFENTTSPFRISKFGALYNWHVVGSGKIAPPGWHVPTDAEWDELVDYLISNGYNWDGTTVDNKIGKSMAAKTDWGSSDVEGSVGIDKGTNNSSGFSGLPGGYRSGDDGTFKGGGWAARWWTATEKYDKSGVYSRHIYLNSVPLFRERVSKAHAFSIRLVKD